MHYSRLMSNNKDLFTYLLISTNDVLMGDALIKLPKRNNLVSLARYQNDIVQSRYSGK